MKGLGVLSDCELVVAYEKAVKLNLDQDFIDILLAELERREIRNRTLLIC